MQQLSFAFVAPLQRPLQHPGVISLPSKFTFRTKTQQLPRSLLLNQIELNFTVSAKSLAIEAAKKAESPRYAAYPSSEWQFEKMMQLQRPELATVQKTRIKEDLMARFQDYIHQQADIQWRRFGQIDGDYGRADIRSAARLAFFEAVERWDSKHNKPLIHLVAKSVRQASSAHAKYLESGQIEFPPKIQKLCINYQRVLETEGLAAAELLLENSNSREETKNIVRTHAATARHNTISINACYSKSDDSNKETPFGDSLADPSCPNSQHESHNIFQIVRDIITRKLNARQRTIFLAIHGNVEQLHDLNKDNAVNLDEGARLHEIAGPLKITRERVRQLREEIYGIFTREFTRLGLTSDALALIG